MNLVVVIKHIHVWCVTLSFALFVVRAMWQLTNSDLLANRVVKVLPHLVDTLLLATGLGMIGLLAYHSSWPSWLSLKIAFIIAYIALGILGFRFSRLYKTCVPLALGCFFTAAFLAINKPFL